jgi:hypothetical protein
MLYLFKRAVSIKGKSFPKGQHEVPAEIELHSYFLKLVNAGLVVEGVAPPVITTASVQKRSEHLFNSIKEKQEKARLARIAKEATKSPELTDDEKELAKMEAEEKAEKAKAAKEEKKKEAGETHPKGKHGKEK